MKYRILLMAFIGIGLALILLAIVQFTSAFSKTSLPSEGEPPVQTDIGSVDTGVSPVFVRTISEYGLGNNKKLRLKGTSEPDAVLTLLNENLRLNQFKADAAGDWEIVINIEQDTALALEVVMFVEGDLSIRGDETIYRLPVPRSTHNSRASDNKSDIETDAIPKPALIMVSAPGGPSRVVQSPFGGSPTNGPLSMGPIDYDNSGGVILSGTTAAEGRVRIYAGGEAFGETRVGAGGRWNFIAGNLLPRGEYPIAAELIDKDGIKARVSVPFELLPPAVSEAKDPSDIPDVVYEPFRWQVRRSLIGGGHQTTAIFAPIQAKALIVETQK